MNDGTSLKSVRQIRRTEYPEYDLGNTRTSQMNNLFLLLGTWTNSVLVNTMYIITHPYI